MRRAPTIAALAALALLLICSGAARADSTSVFRTNDAFQQTIEQVLLTEGASVEVVSGAETANLWVRGTSCDSTPTRSVIPVTLVAAPASAIACTPDQADAEAQPGDLVLMMSGTYSGFDPSDHASATLVRLAAADGETVNWGNNSEWTPGNKGVWIDGVHFTGGWDWGHNGANHFFRNVRISNSYWVAQSAIFVIDTPTGLGSTGLNILIDHNYFTPTIAGGFVDGQINVRWPSGPSNMPDSGVTIRDNEFDGGGLGSGKCSDGAQIGAAAVKLIGNLFHGYLQGECSGPHSDSVQLYGSIKTYLQGNVIYNSTTGIIAYDGEDHPVITGNAIRGIGRNDEALGCSGCDTPTITHNSVEGGCTDNNGDPAPCTINLGSKTGLATTNATVKCNVSSFVNTTPGGAAPTYTVQNWNLHATGSAIGANSIAAAPTWTTPSWTTLAGAVLTAPSGALTGCDDGTKMGVNDTTFGPVGPQ